MRPLITLVPNSAVQFWDTVLDVGRLPGQRRNFWEERISEIPDASGSFPVQLHALVEDEATRELIEPATGRMPPPEDIYAIGTNQAIEPFLNQWVPVPFFLLRGNQPDGSDDFAPGPTNWVRLRIAPLPNPQPGRTHQLTLCFDTALMPEGRDYLAPYPGNAERQEEFGLVSNVEQIGFLLNQPWLGEWLVRLLRAAEQARRGGRAPLEPAPGRGCEHLARYTVLLEMLDAAALLPRVRLLDNVSGKVGYAPVSVDLVLDIGNARTCGLLVEEHPGEGMNLTDSFPLALRDLEQPERVYNRPFDSRVEFARAGFGWDDLSRRSGRSGAFAWASPLRVGPEAVRLAARRQGNKGTTGLSSPKRYLWDERPLTQGWHFNGTGTDGATLEPPVGGPFMQFVAEDGTVLRGRGGPPALRARFSRSSVFTFMLAEVLMQALCQINGPDTRAARRDADKPRRLRRLVLTLPPGMPVFEQQILRSRALGAVRLVWDMLGWSAKPDAMREPQVITNLDEATATQIVWLHNEVAERFAGDAGALFALLGRPRPQYGLEPSLRIASIDIGGGTSDLMISTFTRPQGELILPHQEFRESFKIAGDDVLERVIVTIVLPALERGLQQAGVASPHDLLVRALAQDLSGQSEQERQDRRVFVSQVLEPIGIAVLAAYERVEPHSVDEVFRGVVGAILAAVPEHAGVSAHRLTRHLDEAARRTGASDGFSTAAVEIVADARQIDMAVHAVLGRVLADLCEVTWQYDCDVLLLSGRPSRMRAVADIVLAKVPVAPHRIIGMHRYRVGERYPFRDAANRIDDPKTTAVVGAMLCILAEGRLRNFMLRSSQFAMRSTARFIGRMDNDGQIRDANVLLRNADFDAKDDGVATAEDGFSIGFQALTQIGFRQLPIERWTATPLYVMEFTNPDTVSRLSLPLRVQVGRRTEDPDSARFEAAREHFVVEEVEDATGTRLSNRDVTLRLQTSDDQEGYWRDTGRVAMS
ncbi:MAG TPA: virulence factor SrfB [Rhodopila sp.]